MENDSLQETQLKNEILELAAHMNELRAKAKDTANKLMKVGFDMLFEAYPQLQSISWTQYSPYFNDGDECVFSAHTDDFSVNWIETASEDSEEDEDEDEDYDDYGHESNYTWKHPEGKVLLPESERTLQGEACDKIAELLENFDEDNLKDMFGNHVKVVITRKGVTTDEYSHD